MAEKTSMRRRKYNLTRGTGALKRGIAERDRDVVKSQLDKLKVLFRLFEQTHDLYDRTLVNEDDIDTSTEYFCAAERTYIEAVSDAHKFLSFIDRTKYNVETVGDNVETVLTMLKQLVTMLKQLVSMRKQLVTMLKQLVTMLKQLVTMLKQF